MLQVVSASLFASLLVCLFAAGPKPVSSLFRPREVVFRDQVGASWPCCDAGKGATRVPERAPPLRGWCV